MSEKVEEKDINKVDKHIFYFEKGLYSKVKNEDVIEDIFSGEVEAYSHKLKGDTTYSIDSPVEIGDDNKVYHNYSRALWYGLCKIDLKCKRDSKDVITYYININDGIIEKVGQYPSLADIEYGKLGKKYSKVLTNNQFIEYKKAIGLNAHGDGSGAFVYLRRIFEKLILYIYLAKKSELDINEEDFKKLFMEDKIDLLKEYLPEGIPKMMVVYKILSKGVHELSDEDCKKYFNPLKLSINIILNKKLEEDKKKKEIDEVDKELSSILKEFS